MLSRFAFCFAVVCVAAPASAAPPVHVTAFGRLPVTFEKNTGRYDTRVQFLTRTRGSTVFITRTEVVMVLPMKARGERQEARGAATVSPAPSAGRGSGGGGVAARSSLCDQARGDSPPKRAGITDGSPPSPLPPPTQGGGGNGPLTPRGGSPSALSPQPSAVLRMKLVGANAKAVATGLQKQPGIVNYFIGNDPKKWRTRVPTYAKAKLAGVYPGIDVVYYGTEARGKGQEARAGEGRSSRLSPLASCLEYDFVLKPGADPKRIQLAFEGADRIRVADGDLILSTPAGDVRMKRPYAYQTIGGRRVQVACDYMLRQRSATFRVARYDASRPLVVDPVLEYSTYLGGSLYDQAYGIGVDAQGCAHVVGYTTSPGFPTTAGVYGSSYAGSGDAFVVKLTASAAEQVYSTFIGGGGQDVGKAIAVEASGAVYVTGSTFSADFPTTAAAFSVSSYGDRDAFVLKLDHSGSQLTYSTYIGGTDSDQPEGIAADETGSAYITGFTASVDYPRTPGAFGTTPGSWFNAFVTKLDSAGSSLVYSSVLGGGGFGHGIAVDVSGAAYVAGATSSSSFPTTVGAYCTTHSGGYDAFVAKLNTTGTELVYSTFVGGNHEDGASSIAVDASGAAYVTGGTESTNFPTTPGVGGTSHRGGRYDAIVAKVAPSGAGLVYSTFLGGSGEDWAYGLSVDEAGAVCVAGYTYSSDYPITPDAVDSSIYELYPDAFVTKLNDTGSALAYSTFLGGMAPDVAHATASDLVGSVYIVGETNAQDFPATPGAFQTTPSGHVDGFAAKLTPGPAVSTNVYVPDRAGVVTDGIILRAYLRKTTDAAWISGRIVGFAVAGTNIGSGITTGTGRADLPWNIPDGPETRTIEALFDGDHAYLPSSGTATLTALTTGTKMLGYDRAGRITEYTTLRAMLWRPDNTPVRGKTVTFYVDGTATAATATNTDGRALVGYVITDGSGAGSRTIVADWPGDGGYLASSATSTLYVGKAHPYLWLLSKSCPVGGAVGLYAYFRRLDDYQKQSAKPVTFRVDGTWVADVVTGTGADAGIARYTYHTVEPQGVHTIRCEFAGDAWVEAGYGEATLTIY